MRTVAIYGIMNAFADIRPAADSHFAALSFSVFQQVLPEKENILLYQRFTGYNTGEYMHCQ